MIITITDIVVTGVVEVFPFLGGFSYFPHFSINFENGILEQFQNVSVILVVVV